MRKSPFRALQVVAALEFLKAPGFSQIWGDDAAASRTTASDKKNSGAGSSDYVNSSSSRKQSKSKRPDRELKTADKD